VPVQKTLISSPKIDQNLAKGAVFREKTAVFEDLCLLISTYAYFVRRSFHTPYVNPRHKSSRFSRGGVGPGKIQLGFPESLATSRLVSQDARSAEWTAIALETERGGSSGTGLVLRRS